MNPRTQITGQAEEHPEQDVVPNRDALVSERPGGLPLYGEFFGLREPPFDLTPNPRYLFLNPRQREALSNLRYGLATAKGFTLLLGDAGTGKTTLLRTALAEICDTPNRYVLVNNPTLGRDEFYEFLTQELGLSNGARTSKARFLSDLQHEVEARSAAGGLTGLIIDEAQSASHEILEEIRLLGNIETTTTKLLNVVLCGQPALAEKLNDPALRQLKQRIALRCELRPFTADETVAYVSGRLRIAGGSPIELFTLEAVLAAHTAAAGNPRTINVVCDNALINGFAAQAKPITAAIVHDVCLDFDLATDSDLVQPPTKPPATRGVAPEPQRSIEERPMFGSMRQAKRRFSFFS